MTFLKGSSIKFIFYWEWFIIQLNLCEPGDLENGAIVFKKFANLVKFKLEHGISPQKFPIFCLKK
jgi:hypothetical protein